MAGTVQDRPRCFGCSEIIEYDPIYAAPCGHGDCRSAVFHGVCLMEYREHFEAVQASVARWLRQHGMGGDRS